MTLLMLLACDQGFEDPSREFGESPPDDREFPVVLREPTQAPVITKSLMMDADREVPAGSACTVCHDRQALPSTEEEEFHDEVTVDHSTVTCGQCHDPTNRSQLHLADHTPVEWQKVALLCGQCHGRKKRDYDNGAHGGASGYWDLKVGPQVRNGCLDCHPAHDPIGETTVPVFPPLRISLHD